MNEYGLTPNGPNIKRLDVILDEMHTDLSKRWGVNTRQNPESFINHLLTDVADQIAQLWELGRMCTTHSIRPLLRDGASITQRSTAAPPEKRRQSRITPSIAPGETGRNWPPGP